MPVKLNTLNVTDIEIHKKHVKIAYEPVSERTLFDICGTGGDILYTGKLKLGEKVEIDMSDNQDGTYNLYILDGTILHKRTFRLHSGLPVQEI